MRAVVLLLVAWAAAAGAQPRLMVGIVVDQMRWDYLERYSARYGEGGFKRMQREGYEATQCMINYLPAVTAVGHASVYTGSVPAHTGIISNYFLMGDTVTSSVGGDCTPGLLQPTTITDELRMATNFRGKVVAVAIKDRGSILPGGHTPTAAFWLADDDQGFTTSPYYGTMPQWAIDFNNRQLPRQYMQQQWPATLMYPDDTYTQSHPRDPRIEIMPGDGIRTTPGGATLTIEMAMAAVDGEQLGQDETPDFLCVSISSTDAIAHRTGCNSPYVEDAYLQLDRDLATLFRFLDKRVGKGRWTAFLTADHAGQHNPQWRMDNKVPASVWENGEASDSVNAALARVYGPGEYVKRLSDFRMWLNYNLLPDAALANQIACEALRRLPQTAYAFDINHIPDYVPDHLRRMAVNGYHPQRSGSIAIIPVSGVMEAFRSGEENRKGASHAQWTPDDTHIPCLFMGYGVPRGVRDNRPCHITDIAPTACSILRIQQPNACVGQPIF